MAVTTGMVGHGFYNRHSAPQWAAAERVLPWLEEAIAGMELANMPATIAMVDYGCSEGGNSLRIMQRLVTAMRARTDRPLQILHSDLPTNDFSTLLRNLHPAGTARFGADTYSAIVGGSMFDQLLPPQSACLAMTFNAIGFLSQKPLERLPGYILPNGPSRMRNVGEVTPEEQSIFAARAAEDITMFLNARAAELVPGGKLLLEVFGASEAGRTCDGIYDVLNDAVLEALSEGLVTREAYEAYYQPVYIRTMDELTASVAGSKFSLDRAEAYESPVPFVDDYAKEGNIAAYAQAYTNFFRAFTEAVLVAAFPTDDPETFADDIYGRAERLVREHPERYEFHYVSVAMLLTRQPD